MNSTARHIARKIATHPETKSFAKSVQRNMASGTPSETAKVQANAGADAPTFESIGIKNSDIVQKSGVSLSQQQKVLVGSVLDVCITLALREHFPNLRLIILQSSLRVTLP